MPLDREHDGWGAEREGDHDPLSEADPSHKHEDGREEEEDEDEE